jgi:small subunit ribosomal protein S15
MIKAKSKKTTSKKSIQKTKTIKKPDETKSKKAKVISEPVTDKKKKQEIAAIDHAELAKLGKQDLIKKFAQKEGDTGSPEVQIAIATQKIYNLTRHLEENPKDNHSRRGLLKIISKRRRILSYLMSKDEKRYKTLIKHLGLKK